MESIVSKRNDLGWDGWNIVKYTTSSSAIFSADGALKDGAWVKRKIFPITENGWEVPKSIGEPHAAMER
jgi:hypothetical protein